MKLSSIFPPKTRLQWGATLGGLCILALLGAHLFGSGDAATEDSKKPKATPVTAAKAIAKSMPVNLTAIGHIQPIASVSLRPRVEGEITQVLVKDGQDVKTGDTLVLLDSREAQATLDQAQANLTKDSAQLDFAQHEAERFRALLQQSAGSKEQMEQAKANAEALVGTVKADQAIVAQDAAQLSYMTIAAPITGRIGTVASKEGNIIQPTDASPLAIINQIAPIYVAFSLPESAVPPLQQAIGKGPVKVAVSAPGDSTSPETGELAYIENAVDPTSGTLAVRATLPNAAERLWPGQFVNVVVTLRTEPNAVVVPSVAVQPGQDGFYVFVIKPDSTVESRNVTVDRTVGDETVIAKGLQAGETVVTTGQLRLTPGARVTVQQTQASRSGAGVAS